MHIGSSLLIYAGWDLRSRWVLDHPPGPLRRTCFFRAGVVVLVFGYESHFIRVRRGPSVVVPPRLARKRLVRETSWQSGSRPASPKNADA
jgi:hypothetical protein